MSNRPAPWATAQLFNAPLLLHPPKITDILIAIQSRLVIGGDLDVESIESQLSRFDGEWATSVDARGGVRLEPYKRIGNVGVISVVGSLVDRGGWIGANSGVVSHEGIKQQFKRAALDPNVRAIVADVSSAGGEASGFRALAEYVRRVASEKPVYAVANSMALSGGYAMISGATRIIASPSSRLGSIGVYHLHLDKSEQLAAEGIRPTIIFAGARKVDGNSTEPLKPEVRDRLQKEVDAIYGEFLDVVAAGRGRRMSRKAARETEADTFFPDDAVAAGLADAVGTFEEVVAAAQKKIDRGAAPRGQGLKGTRMSSNVLGENDGPTISQADVDKARAEGRADGAKGERDRLSKILGDERVKGREAAALALATKAPEMSVDDVVGFVADHAAAPKAAKDNSDRSKIADDVDDAGVNDVETNPAPAPSPRREAEKVASGWGAATAIASQMAGFRSDAKN